MLKLLTKNWPIVIIIILALSISWPLFQPGYFFHHDDLHLMRIYEMRRCIEDLEIPCRWGPDIGVGYGFPIFNYYSVLPYYIGALLSFLTGFLLAAKILFFIPLIFGPLAMFFLAKELFGEKAALVASTLYLFAPYRALDTYVRGDITEMFGMSIIPLVFFFFLKFIKKVNLKNLLGSIISLSAFLLCHNIMTLIFVPFLLIWIGFWVITLKFKNFKVLLLSLILGFGISSFFLIPAFFEKELVQVNTLTEEGFQFWIHFTTLKQLLFDRAWGYGSSGFGPVDTISFQIGWPHWWLSLFALLLIFLKLPIFKKLKSFTNFISIKNQKIFFFLFIFFLIAIFMTHNKSTLIWQNIKILQFAQFPWRFLSIAFFSISLIGGFVVSSLKGKAQIFSVMTIILFTIYFNFSYFVPSDFYPEVIDKSKLTGDYFQFQQRATIKDYLPKDASVPKNLAPNKPIIHSGKVEVKNFENKSNRWSTDLTVNEESNIEIPIFDFPYWRIYVNDKQTQFSKTKQGTMELTLGKGTYKIIGKLIDSPIRIFANTLTIVSLLLTFLLAKYARKRLAI